MLGVNRTSPALWFTLIIVSIFYAYEFFLRIIPSLLVDVLQSQYHINALGLSSFATSYFIGYVLMQIPAGFIFERYPFRWMSAAGLLICVFGTLLFTSAHQLWIGLLGRFILGCGSAFAFIGAITFIRLYFSEKLFTLLIASVISVGTIAGSFGQVFAASIISHLTWRYTVDGMAAWGILLAIVLICIPEHYFKRMNTLEKNLSLGRELCCILREKKLWLNGFLGSFLYLPTSVLAAVWGITYFTKAFNLSAELAATGIMFLFMGWALGGPVVSFIAEKKGHEKKLLAAASLMMAGLLFFIFIRTELNGFWLCFILLLFGLISSAQVLVWRLFTDIFPNKALVGTASSATNLIIMLSIALWDLLIGKLISYLQHDAVHSIELTQLRPVLLLLPCLVLISPLFLLGLKKNKK